MSQRASPKRRSYSGSGLTRGLHLDLYMPVSFLIVNRQPLLHQEVVAASCLQVFDQDILQHPCWGQTWREDQSISDHNSFIGKQLTEASCKLSTLVVVPNPYFPDVTQAGVRGDMKDVEGVAGEGSPAVEMTVTTAALASI